MIIPILEVFESVVCYPLVLAYDFLPRLYQVSFDYEQ